MRSSTCIAAIVAAVLLVAPARAEEHSGRRLQQTINYQSGQKFGPPENYFSLVSRGGPLSSIQGTRTTDVKVGSPPRPPAFVYTFDPKRSDTKDAGDKKGGGDAPKGAGDKKAGGRRLSQTINYQSGQKFGPPENYFSLVSRGGPLSSIQGTRTTDVKVGSPPRPPAFVYTFDPKRSDTKDAGDKKGGGDAPKGAGDKKAGGRRLSQTINYQSGQKFGPPENYFSLVSRGGPLSSIQGTRTTDVKVGSPPRPPAFVYTFDPKRSDTKDAGDKKGGGDTPKGAGDKKAGGRRLSQTINYQSGQKFGPPENYFSLVSRGGPLSSIQGTRTTDVKVGSPPRPPAFVYTFDPKRSDTKDAGDKKGGGDAPKGAGDKKAGGRRLSQTINYQSGQKFGPPENYFSLVSRGGPLSSIQGTRTTDVKVGSPPRPPAFVYTFDPKRSDTKDAGDKKGGGDAPKGAGDKKAGGRRLSQTINYQSGQKFGPPENYFSLVSRGGPLSSIQGTRTTDVKVGSPPRPPAFVYTFDPKRSDTKDAGDKKGGGDAPKGAGDKKAGGRRLSQTINYQSGQKFGPPENYFSLVSRGGPLSSIQGTRTTDVKVGSPPRPPAFVYTFDPKRSDTKDAGDKKGGGDAPKGAGDKKAGGRRLSQTINYQSGQKFGPPENYFSLVSRGGPLSSIQGTRTTDVKVGSPPRPPAFVYTFDPKRSDTKDAGDKKGGGDAPKGAGDKKAGGRRLSQTINYQSGQKFGPPENYFSLVSRGGPLSSIQGTRTTDVKVGSPPRPPAFVYTFDPKRSDTKDAGDKKGGGDAPKGAGDKKAGGRRLSQTINYQSGQKFGPPENYFSLVSRGGPLSSIQGTRTTDVKVGSPPRPPAFVYTFDPKRSDTKDAGDKKGGGDAPKGAGDKKAGGRRLSQTINYQSGQKFGPPENYFSLVSRGGPLSSIQGTRTTDVKVGSPPRPPAFVYTFDPKRSDTKDAGDKKGAGDAPKGAGDKKAGGRRLSQTINYQSGQKFGPPENYFSLVSRGGPLSSIQGTRTTDVKVGSPPRPPAFVYTFDPKRSDGPAAKEGAKAEAKAGTKN